jgi:hypothetical protein
MKCTAELSSQKRLTLIARISTLITDTHMYFCRLLQDEVLDMAKKCMANGIQMLVIGKPYKLQLSTCTANRATYCKLPQRSTVEIACRPAPLSSVRRHNMHVRRHNMCSRRS